jgi:hypothetical protein
LQVPDQSGMLPPHAVDVRNIFPGHNEIVVSRLRTRKEGAC